MFKRCVVTLRAKGGNAAHGKPGAAGRLLLPPVASRADVDLATLEGALLLRHRLEESGIRIYEGPTSEARKSIFSAHAAVGIQDAQDVQRFGEYVRKAIDHGATHPFMHAYSIPASGESGGDCDGETGASSRIAQVINDRWRGREDGICVAVSRWYGGVQLGGKRFAMIAGAANQVIDGI